MKPPTLVDLKLSGEDQAKVTAHIEMMKGNPAECVAVISPDPALRADILYALLGAYTSDFSIGYAESPIDVDVVTIESKTAYTLSTTKLMVRQVSLEGSDQSFADAVKSALRSDPPYALVGEVAPEGGAFIMQAAMTGHCMLVGIAGTKKEDALTILDADAGALGLMIVAPSREDIKVG